MTGWRTINFWNFKKFVRNHKLFLWFRNENHHKAQTNICGLWWFVVTSQTCVCDFETRPVCTSYRNSSRGSSAV